MTRARSRPPLAELLDLSPHPEGGWFRQTWTAPQSFTPDGYPGPRQAASAIYFVLHPGEESRWHRVRSDELWLWHRGGSLRVRLGGSGEEPAERAEEVAEEVLGPGLEAGERPQLLVPGGVWQAEAPAGTEPVLVTCVVAPAFDFEDFRML